MELTYFVTAEIEFMGQRSTLQYGVLASDEQDAIATATKDVKQVLSACSSGRLLSVNLVK